jgi:hypothetical protein
MPSAILPLPLFFGTKTATNSEKTAGVCCFFARQIARSRRISAELNRSLAVNFGNQRKTAKLQ